MNTKEKKVEIVACKELDALGWDTESTSDARKRAFRGSCINPTFSTSWHETWRGVLEEIKIRGEKPWET